MLNRESAILIVIDIQGNLFDAMHSKEALLKNSIKVVKGAKIFSLPMEARPINGVVSETTIIFYVLEQVS